MYLSDLCISWAAHPVNEALDISDPRPCVCDALGQIFHLGLSCLHIRCKRFFLSSQSDHFLCLPLPELIFKVVIMSKNQIRFWTYCTCLCASSSACLDFSHSRSLVASISFLQRMNHELRKSCNYLEKEETLCMFEIHAINMQRAREEYG